MKTKRFEHAITGRNILQNAIQGPTKSAVSTRTETKYAPALPSVIYAERNTRPASRHQLLTGIGRWVAPAVAAVMLACAVPAIGHAQAIQSPATTIEHADIHLDNDQEWRAAEKLIGGLIDGKRYQAALTVIEEIDLSNAYASSRIELKRIEGRALEGMGKLDAALAAYEQAAEMSKGSSNHVLADIARVVAANPSSKPADLVEALETNGALRGADAGIFERYAVEDAGSVLDAAVDMLNRNPTPGGFQVLAPVIFGAVTGDLRGQPFGSKDQLENVITDLRAAATKPGAQNAYLAEIAGVLEEIRTADLSSLIDGDASATKTVQLAKKLKNAVPLADFIDLYATAGAEDMSARQRLARFLLASELSPGSGSARYSALVAATMPGVDPYGTTVKELGKPISDAVLAQMGEMDLEMQKLTHLRVADWLIQRHGESAALAPALVQQYAAAVRIDQIEVERFGSKPNTHLYEKLAASE